MENRITYDNIRSFAYTNADMIKGKVNGILIRMCGLNFNEMYDTHFDFAAEDAKNGIIVLVPYYNPWCWMNDQTVAFVDTLIDVLKQHFRLDSVKISTTGLSMGGQCTLMYSMRSRHRNEIVTCAANCPVSDVVYHSTERKDLPRTFLSAYGSFEPDVLKKYSPLHNVDDMPDHIQYYIFHTTADKAVNKTMHSDRLVDKMRREKKKVEYFEIFDRGHCDLSEEYSVIYEKLSRENLLS